MMVKRQIGFALLLALAHSGGSAAAELSAKKQLGKSLFFDANLSQDRNQSCATCHGPAVGWTGPDGALNSKGSVKVVVDGVTYYNDYPSVSSGIFYTLLRGNTVDGVYSICVDDYAA